MAMLKELLLVALPVSALAQTTIDERPITARSGLQLHILAARPKLDDVAFGVGQRFRPGVLVSIPFVLTDVGKRGAWLGTGLEFAYREHKVSTEKNTFYRADSYMQVPLTLTVSAPTNPARTARFEPMIGVAAGALVNRDQTARDSAGNIRRSDYYFGYGFVTAIASFGWAATSAGGTRHRFGIRAMADGRTLFDNHKTPATKYDSYSIYYVFSPPSRRQD